MLEKIRYNDSYCNDWHVVMVIDDGDGEQRTAFTMIVIVMEI